MLYYFQVPDKDEAVAVVRLYAPPDEELFITSWCTLWVCSKTEHIVAVNARSIQAAVGMVPFPTRPGEDHLSGTYFLVEDFGEDVTFDEELVNRLLNTRVPAAPLGESRDV